MLNLQIQNRRNAWLAISSFALCWVILLSAPYVVDLPVVWLGTDWGDRLHGVFVSSGLFCGLGLQLLQWAFGLPRRSWRSRLLALGVFPIFLVPALLANEICHRPFAPDVKLHTRALPGYRIELPAWPSVKEDADYWSGSLTVRRRFVEESVNLEWIPGDGVTTAQLVESIFLKLSKFAPLGEEAATVAAKPSRTYYYGGDGWIAARTSWDCADGRVATLTTMLQSPQEISRAFHGRILKTIACEKTPPPAPVHPAFTPPPGFVLQETGPGGRSYVGADEILFLTECLKGTKLRDLVLNAQARGAVVDVVLQTLKVSPAEGPEQNIEDKSQADRPAWIRPVVFADQRPGRFTLTTWYCAKSNHSFWALHLGLASAPPNQGIERLRMVSCPASP